MKWRGWREKNDCTVCGAGVPCAAFRLPEDNGRDDAFQRHGDRSSADSERHCERHAGEAGGLCDGKANVLDKDNCLKNLAIENNDSSVCAGIYSVDVRDDCMLVFAANGIDVCNAISDGAKKDTCIDINARNQNSIEMCNMIGAKDLRLSCVNAVSPPCLALVDPQERQTCMAVAYLNISMCQSDDCFFQYGIQTNDTAACDKISFPYKQEACISLATGSVVCDNLNLTPDRNYCYELVAEAKNNVTFCDLASAASSYQTNCYTNLAISTDTPQYCSRPPMEPDQNSCYFNYSLATGKTDWCSNITYSLLHDDCYRKGAIKYNNPAICNGIPAGAERIACYSLVLSSDMLFTLADCSGVISPEWQDTCYYRVAIQSGDVKLCDLIAGNTTRLNCVGKFIQ